MTRIEIYFITSLFNNNIKIIKRQKKIDSYTEHILKRFLFKSDEITIISTTARAVGQNPPVSLILWNNMNSHRHNHLILTSTYTPIVQHQPVIKRIVRRWPWKLKKLQNAMMRPLTGTHSVSDTVVTSMP